MRDHAFLFVSYVILLIALGVALLLAPRRAQRIALRSMRAGLTARTERLESFVSSGAFIWNVRATGAIALLMALLMTWAARIPKTVRLSILRCGGTSFVP